jgi:diguanylate cyclase
MEVVLFFGAGLVAGFGVKVFANVVAVEGVISILSVCGRILCAPFVLIRRILGKAVPFFKREQDAKELITQQPLTDSREQQISDSVQTVRNIMLSLAVVIQQTDKAASDSSKTLGSVRHNLTTTASHRDLLAAHAILLEEIDRVISSNGALKLELDCSREILANQRQQIESLKTASRIDGLTQLANRSYFDEKLGEAIAMAKQEQVTFSLLLIDIDHFKNINDTFGHQGGDRVLKGIAFKMRSSVRESDFSSRFGGDEFAVILHKTRAGMAADVAWKLCMNLRESSFVLDETKVNVTVSIGVAEVCEGDTIEKLLGRADEALYKVKTGGRNRVCVSDKPSAGMI